MVTKSCEVTTWSRDQLRNGLCLQFNKPRSLVADLSYDTGVGNQPQYFVVGDGWLESWFLVGFSHGWFLVGFWLVFGWFFGCFFKALRSSSTIFK